MNIFNNKKFDLILSIGQDCACAVYLNKFKLRNSSYPFDWLTKSNFDTRINLILNGFKDFCNKEDFVKLENIRGEIADYKNIEYENKKTNFYFYHDFDINLEFDKAYEIVKERYERRINRFYNNINKSKDILFVFWGRSDVINNEQLKEYYKKLNNKFQNQNIYLLILENIPNQNDFIEEHISDNIIKIKYDMTSYDLNKPQNACTGNVSLNDKIFKQLKLKKTLLTRLKSIYFYICVKFPAMFIPIKSVRRNFKEKMKLLILKED